MRSNGLPHQMHRAQRHVNHIGLVLDASLSMQIHQRRVPEVADRLIRDLALASEEKQQETRVSVWLFGEDTVRCLIWDMDVMRTPSITDLYEVLHENTALIDAALISQHDFAEIPTFYGEHAFMTYFLTDGEENRSFRFAHMSKKGQVLRDLLERARLAPSLPQSFRPRTLDRVYNANTLANASIAWIVPNYQSRRYVEMLGAPTGNVIEWDTTDSDALVDVGARITASAVNFMAGRERGVTMTRSAFSVGDDAVNTASVGQAVQARILTPVDPSRFVVFQNDSGAPVEMRPFVQEHGVQYRTGTCFYRFWKTEHVQPQKSIVIRRKATGEVFTDPAPASPAVRAMIGLGTDHTEKVPATMNAEYDIFIQSTAPNRKIIQGRSALVMDPVYLAQPGVV